VATDFHTKATTAYAGRTLRTESEEGTSAVAAATNLAFCVSRRRQLVDRHGGIAAPGKTEEEVPAEMISLRKIRSCVPGLLAVAFLVVFNAEAASTPADSPVSGKPYSLAIDVYAGLVAVDQSIDPAFIRQLMALSEGTGPAPAELDRILHLEHSAAGEFDLVGEGTADGQSRSVRVHVTQKPDGRLFLQFSDLGGPSQSLFSHNQLLLGPGEREFLRFQDTPGSGGKVLTSVVLVTTSKQ